MAADAVPYFRPQFLDANGEPLAGGKVYTYKAGTTTPITTYQDSIYTPNLNPIILDSSGCADIFIGLQPVKFVIHDANDVLIKTVDNIIGAGGTAVGIQTVVPIVTNGSTTTFALGVDPEVAQNCTVVVKPTSGDSRVYLTSEYTVDGQNLTFSAAPPAGTGEIRIGQTRSIGSSGLSDGIVTTGKIQDLAVTNAKLAENSVGTSKIQDNAITTAKVVDGAVTTAKIENGAITNAKRAALGQQISSSCGTYVISALTGGYVAVTNLSVTITTTGRPVFVALVPSGEGDYSVYRLNSTNQLDLQIRRGSTALLTTEIQGMGAVFLPIQTFVVDVPSSGTYTYSVNVNLLSGSTPYFQLRQYKLLAFEL